MVGLKRRALQATSAPHTPATYPSHIPQLHLHLHLHLHLQLPIVATPLSCTSYGLLRSYMGMLLHRIPP